MTVCTLKQTMSDGTTHSASFNLPVLAGAYNVTCHLSNGKAISAGQIIIDNTSQGRTHKWTITMDNGKEIAGEFTGRFGLYRPILSEPSYRRDSYSNSYWGSITVTNPNNVAVDVLVWFKTSNSEDISENGSFTLAAGGSKEIMFGDIYSEGLLTRIHFVAYSRGINEDEVFTQESLGDYKGTYNFYEPEETTTTTTTTTTPASNTELVAVESDGKFTLWRNEDVK